MSRALLVLVLVLAGCGGAELRLDPKWSPLRRVQETQAQAKGRATTVGSTVYVRSLAWLDQAFPLGVQRDAFLLHEQEHARAQERIGLLVFLARYGASAEFMWEEESRGWALQLRHLKQNGVRVDPVKVAAALSSYRVVLSGERMVSFPDAEKWARAILAGAP